MNTYLLHTPQPLCGFQALLCVFMGLVRTARRRASGQYATSTNLVLLVFAAAILIGLST